MFQDERELKIRLASMQDVIKWVTPRLIGRVNTRLKNCKVMYAGQKWYIDKVTDTGGISIRQQQFGLYTFVQVSKRVFPAVKPLVVVVGKKTWKEEVLLSAQWLYVNGFGDIRKQLRSTQKSLEHTRKLFDYLGIKLGVK